MHTRSRRLATVGGGIAFAVALLAATVPAGTAGATATGGVSFAHADFSGYSSGEIAHLNLLDTPLTSGKSVADIEEAFSGGSVDTAGLAKAIVGDSQDGSLTVQPALSGGKYAYGSGAGATVGLDATAPTSSQVALSGLAQQSATPNGAEVVSSLPNASGLDVSGLLQANLLTGRADAFFGTDSCPLGQPLSYGLGDAANASLLDLSSLTGASTVTSGLQPVLSLLQTLLGSVPGLGSTLKLPAVGSGALVQNEGGDTKTVSESYLSANTDGTFGLTTAETETVAPIDINVLGLATIRILVGGTITDGSVTESPITLSSRVTGEGSGAVTTLANQDELEVQLVAAGTTTDLVPPTSLNTLLGKGGVNLDLSLGTVLDPYLDPVLKALPSSLSSLSSAIGTLLGASLGQIDIATPVRAINGAASTLPTPPVPGTASTTEGTRASGAWDLVHVDLAPTIPTTSALGNLSSVLSTLSSTLSGLLGMLGLGTLPSIPTTLPGSGTSTTLLDVNVAHMETKATLAAPITCTIPVIKTADPSSVTAGSNFTYTIDVPNPVDIPSLACNLDDLSVTDVISDASGTPTFTVKSVNDGGTITQSSSSMATLTWKGLTYKVAPVGHTPNPPIQLVVDVYVPKGSSTGVVQDLATASATLGTCTGGASGATDLGGVSGDQLTGQYQLTAPSVTATPIGTGPTTTTTTTPGAVSTSATPTPQALPRTGGTGGFWQPAAGLVALGLGGATIALVRRSRRRPAA